MPTESLATTQTVKVNPKAQGKAILITGCSTGIGQVAALYLHQRGYQVIASVRKHADIAPLKKQGLPHVIQLDLRDSNSIDLAVEKTLEICQGNLFALFNNGAYGQPGAVEDLTRDILREQFETNLFGVHELTTKLLPSMLAQDDARIIQNSSILGFAAMPMRGAYNASKFALEGLTDTLRLELKGSSIKISLIEPGPIATNFRENALEALTRNVDFAGSRHKVAYEKSVARLTSKSAPTPFTLPSMAVVKKLEHALTAKRPKARYYVTVPTYLFAFLRHILPTRWLDKISIAAAGA
ncbi:MAG: short-chain dehydrogenase [Alteromonadaceae bacterium]|nr:MAG: short-chain dehydrogenase [Alteromonadaceae bacterium]